MINTEQANFATKPIDFDSFWCLYCEVYCSSNQNNERGCDADPSSQTAQEWCDVLPIRKIRERRQPRKKDRFVSGNSSLRETSQVCRSYTEMLHYYFYSLSDISASCFILYFDFNCMFETLGRFLLARNLLLKHL